ncbi:TPA: sugar transferase, partial [Streptococcus agalactiae]
LWNILKGDMSIVGPRPLLVEYLPLYSEKQRKRHNVRPGLTGLAQVNGRNAISWEEKFDLDVYYVDKISFFNDLIIIIQTCKKVIKKENINTINNNIPEKFKGS